MPAKNCRLEFRFWGLKIPTEAVGVTKTLNYDYAAKCYLNNNVY